MPRFTRVLALTGWIVAVVSLLSPVASARSWSMTQWFQSTVATQRHRLELLQSLQPSEQMLRAYLDAGWQEQDPQTWEWNLRLQGWQFECAGAIGTPETVYKVDLHLNAYRKDVTNDFDRYLRSDIPINPGLAAWCPGGISPFTGVDITTEVGILPGWYDVKLEFWLADGRNVRTNALWKYIH